MWLYYKVLNKWFVFKYVTILYYLLLNCSWQRWIFQIRTPQTPILRHTEFIHHFINALRPCLLYVVLVNIKKIYTLCPPSMFMWFLKISEQKMIIFLDNSNILVFTMDSVYCTVQTRPLNIIMVKCHLKRVIYLPDTFFIWKFLPSITKFCLNALSYMGFLQW
jgi:hypothetical protein